MLSDWAFRFRSLFKYSAVERELDDELRFHIEHLVESHMRQGLARDEAVRRAGLEFGGLDQIREEHRDARGIRFVDDLGQDVQYAARQVARSPGFALLAVLCLGLGIGVNTTIFGVINSVLLRPMPVAEPERLIMVTRGDSAAFSYPAYRDFHARTRVLSGLAAAFPMESDLDVDGESDFVVAEVVSANYADVLGVKPSLGRWFVDDREPVAVISHAVWERRFNLSPQVVGRRIRSEAQSYTIVGVAPREFTGVFAPFRTDTWVPIRTRPQLAARLERGNLRLMLFGRLGEDATPLTGQALLVRLPLAPPHAVLYEPAWAHRAGFNRPARSAADAPKQCRGDSDARRYQRKLQQDVHDRRATSARPDPCGIPRQCEDSARALATSTYPSRQLLHTITQPARLARPRYRVPGLKPFSHWSNAVLWCATVFSGPTNRM